MLNSEAKRALVLLARRFDQSMSQYSSWYILKAFPFVECRICKKDVHDDESEKHCIKHLKEYNLSVFI